MCLLVFKSILVLTTKKVHTFILSFSHVFEGNAQGVIEQVCSFYCILCSPQASILNCHCSSLRIYAFPYMIFFREMSVQQYDRMLLFFFLGKFPSKKKK